MMSQLITCSLVKIALAMRTTTNPKKVYDFEGVKMHRNKDGLLSYTESRASESANPQNASASSESITKENGMFMIPYNINTLKQCMKCKEHWPGSFKGCPICVIALQDGSQSSSSESSKIMPLSPEPGRYPKSPASKRKRSGSHGHINKHGALSFSLPGERHAATWSPVRERTDGVLSVAVANTKENDPESSQLSEPSAISYRRKQIQWRLNNENNESMKSSVEPQTSHVDENSGTEAPTGMDKYCLGKRLGRGGFGIVYAAHLINDENTKFAIKKLLKYHKQASDEVDLLKPLTHKHVIRCMDSFWHENYFHVVFEFANARDLKDLIKKRKVVGRWETISVAKLFIQIVHGMAFLHDKKIMHRDLKPANIVINRIGSEADNFQMKIADFGLAKEMGGSKKQSATRCGTELYMSPEMLNRTKYSFENDVWALGCILFELCTLTSTFEKLADVFNEDRLKRNILQITKFAKVATDDIPHWKELSAICTWILDQTPSSRPSCPKLFTRMLSAHMNMKYKSVVNPYLLTPGSPKTVDFLSDFAEFIFKKEIKIDYTPYFEMIKEGDYIYVESFLNVAGVQVNTKDGSDQTGLMMAAERGNKDMVAVLLKHPDIDINITDSSGKTAFMAASKNGHIAVVERLLCEVKHSVIDAQSGTDVSRRDSDQRDKRFQIISVVNINGTNSYGESALMLAAESGHKDLVELLQNISHVDINAKHVYGWTAFMFGAAHGHTGVVKVLLKHSDIDVNARDPYGSTAFLLAASRGRKNVVSVLLNHSEIDFKARNDDDKNAVMLAAQGGHKKLVQFLLHDSKFRISDVDFDGWAVQNGYEDIVDVLQHCDVNDIAQNNYRNPVMVVAKNGDKTMLEFLIQLSKVDVKANVDGKTSVMLAAENGHADVVDLLLKHSSDSLKLLQPLTVSVTAGAGYPGSRKFGMTISFSSLKIIAIEKGGWADKHTNLGDYIGWRLSRLNFHDISDKYDFDKVVSCLSVDKPVIFELQSIQISKGSQVMILAPSENEEVSPECEINGKREMMSWDNSLMENCVGKIAVAKQRAVSPDAKWSDPWWVVFPDDVSRRRFSFPSHLLQMQSAAGHPHTAANAKDDNGRTPLMSAAEKGHQAVVELLLENPQIEVNAKNNFGRTALMMAASNGHLHVAELLLDQSDIDTKAKNSDGRDAFVLAATHGRKSLVECFLRHGDIDMDARVNAMVRCYGKTALSAEGRQHDHEADVLITESEQKDYQGVIEVLLYYSGGDAHSTNTSHAGSPVMLAAEKGLTGVMQMLLQYPEIDINTKGTSGLTPLMLAACYGHTDVIELLLEQPGILVNAHHNYGKTALIWAACCGHKDVVELLLEHPEVEVNSKDHNGVDALMLAAQNGHAEVTDLLLTSSKIDSNAVNNDRQTAYMLAVQNGHKELAESLRIFKAETNITEAEDHVLGSLKLAVSNGHQNEIEQLLQQNKINANAKDEIGVPMCMLAAESGRKEVLQFLLNHFQIEVNARDQQGKTALMRAAPKGNMEVVKFLLQDSGIEPNATDDDSNTAFMLAARSGSIEVVNFLLQQSALDVNVKDLRGRDAFMMASANGHQDVIDILIQRELENNPSSRRNSNPNIRRNSNPRQNFASVNILTSRRNSH